MPLYDYRCSHCAAERTDVFNRMRESESNAPVCCGAPMGIVIQIPMVAVQPEAHYVCPATRQKVTSWRQRRNLFAEHRLMDANDFPPEQVVRDTDKKWNRIRELAKPPKELEHVKLQDLVPAPG